MDDRDRARVDGCATFFLEAVYVCLSVNVHLCLSLPLINRRFDLRLEHTVELGSLAATRSSGSSTMLNRFVFECISTVYLLRITSHLLSVMPKDNIAVLVVLEHRATRTPLVVVNAHFTWDPQFADVKVVQALLLMQEVQSVLDSSPIAPKVVLIYYI
jgi:hypothetical protein